MSRFLRLIGVFFFMSACSQKSDSIDVNKSVPLSGNTMLPQIVFLVDSSNEALKLKEQRWGEFTHAALSSELPARIDFQMVATLEDAVEKLNVLNGRALDFVFLGVGLPQRAWRQISLPRNEKRQVFAFAPEAPDATYVSILPDYKSIHNFVKNLCEEAFVQGSCLLLPNVTERETNKIPKIPFIVSFGDRALESTIDGKAVSLSVWFDWSEFLRFEILSGRSDSAKKLSKGTHVWGFDTSYLKISKGSLGSLEKAFDTFLLNWELKNLSGRQKNGDPNLPPADLLRLKPSESKP